jgi:hypothetical protein
MRGLGAKALLQPFAHGIADRSAGLAIDPIVVVVDSAVHGEFRFVIRFRCRWIKSLMRKMFPAVAELSLFLVKFRLKGHGLFHNRKQRSPGRRAGAVLRPDRTIGSIAAIDQAPARSPGGRDQSPHIAAAVTVSGIGAVPVITGPAGKEARTAPAAVPSTMPPTMAAKGRGRGRRQGGHTERSRGNCNKREFA